MAPADLTVDARMAREEAALWGFLHDLFRPPSAEQWNWLREEPARSAWTMLAGKIGREIVPVLPVPDSQAAFEEDYLSAFEVGLPHPPCPLIESHWNHTESVPKVLHENVLFYRHFGLEMRPSTLETADHLRFQFDFLRYLALLCSQALDQKQYDKVTQIERARGEYLVRHLGWVPEAARTGRETLFAGWRVEWLNLLAGCVELNRGEILAGATSSAEP